MDMKQQAAVRLDQSRMCVLEHNDSPILARVHRGHLPQRGAPHDGVTKPTASLPFTLIGATRLKIGLQLMTTAAC